MNTERSNDTDGAAELRVRLRRLRDELRAIFAEEDDLLLVQVMGGMKVSLMSNFLHDLDRLELEEPC